MPAKATSTNPGSFSLVHISTMGAERHSSGLTTLDVKGPDGEVIGQVFSAYPPGPRPMSGRDAYVMWWGSRDAGGTVLHEPGPGHIQYYLAAALAKRHQALARGVRPADSYVGDVAA